MRGNIDIVFFVFGSDAYPCLRSVSAGTRANFFYCARIAASSLCIIRCGGNNSPQVLMDRPFKG